ISNPRNPSDSKKAISRAFWAVLRRRSGLYHWSAGVHGGLLLAVTETHHQIQVNHDRGHDHLKAGFSFPKISALTNPPSHQPGNPMFDDDAFAQDLFSSLGLIMGAGLLLQSFFGLDANTAPPLATEALGP